MVKTKRVIGMALAVVFTTMSMMTMPAQAATKKKVTAKKVVVVPAKVTTVDGPADEYQPGDPVEVSVKAANTSAKVQYRVSMVNAGKRVELYTAKTKFFGPALSGKVETTLKMKAFGTGTAAMLVYAKAVGSTKAYDSVASYKFVVQPRPTAEPTEEPTVEPTAEPTTAPTTAPSVAPSVEPTAAPSVAPTAAPAATKADIKVTSTKTFTATFDGAVADTSKVTFEVKKDSSAISTLTTTWDADKKVATLTSSTKLSQGNYTVVAKVDGKEAGTLSTAIVQEKVAKITVLSDTLSVVTNTSSSIQTGYATYKVENQYGEDITNSTLASGITWTGGIGTITASKGLLTVTATSTTAVLTALSTMTLTAIDYVAPVTSTTTLKVAAVAGTLSDLKLVGLKDNSSATLTAGDTSSVFYADFVATDICGNPTTSYKLVQNGLLSVISSTYVSAQLVQDPTDSNKAAIEVKVTSAASNLTVDMPVTISAITKTGKTSTINVTLKKASAVDSFSMSSPTTEIAVGETKEIPYAAVDQNGNAVTSYSKLQPSGIINFSCSTGTMNWAEQSDGSAKLYYTAGSIDGSQTITATTKTGKYTSMSVYVQKPATPSTLSLDSSVIVPCMQIGATQGMDVGALYGGVSVLDQYDRSVSLLKVYNDATPAPTYVIYASSSDASVVSITNPVLYGTSSVIMNAINPGTATISYKLVKFSDIVSGALSSTATIYDTKSVTVSVVKNDDIVGYSVSELDNVPARTTNTAANFVSLDTYYGACPTVYGKTSAGSLVALASSSITDEFIDNNNDFIFDGVYQGNGNGIIATTLASTTATSSTKYTAVITIGGKTHTASTTLTSKNENLVAQSVDATISATDSNITRTCDTVYMPASYAALKLDGKMLTRYAADGTTTGRASAVYFYAKDQFGLKGAAIKSVMISAYNVTSGTPTITNNVLSLNGVTVNSGNSITLTAYTANGLSKTIIISFK